MLRPWTIVECRCISTLMRDTQTVIVLSVVATVLVLGIGAYIAINPRTAIGLIPILTAIAKIISAIGGGGPTTAPDDPPEPIKAPPTADAVVATTSVPQQSSDDPTECGGDVGAPRTAEEADREVAHRGHDSGTERRAGADAGGIVGAGGAVARPEGVDEEMLRRDVLAAGSVALFGAPVLSAPLNPPAVPGDIPLPSQLGMTHVAEIRTTTEQLRTAARLQGGQVGAVRAAAAHYGRLTQVPANESVAAGLGSQLADLHNLAGWCCFDSGLDSHAWWHYRQAFDYARRVGDDYQLSDALLFAGVIDATRGRPNDALALYQLAQMKLGPQGDPEQVAWLHAVSAHALATMGHNQADDQLARAWDGWEPSNIYHRADMVYQTALVQYELGHLDVAEKFAGAVNDAGLHRPVRIFARILHATVHVQAGEPRGTDLARQAIDGVAGLRSVRARERLALLAAALDARLSSDARELAVHARRVAAVPA